MKSDIHPKYFQATVTCACGNTFIVGSTKETMRVDICSSCHPFFTGDQKFVDTQGRVEKFLNKQKLAEKNRQFKKAKKAKTQSLVQPKSLKEMLQQAK